MCGHAGTPCQWRKPSSSEAKPKPFIKNINYSKDFYSCFRPFVINEVRHCVNKYFSSRLPQTRFPPPLNLQADKGTNCRRTRQFTSIVTVVPDSKDLLTNIYLSQPVVKLDDDPSISWSIIDELTKEGIVSLQIKGASFDGRYQTWQLVTILFIDIESYLIDLSILVVMAFIGKPDRSRAILAHHKLVLHGRNELRRTI